MQATFASLNKNNKSNKSFINNCDVLDDNKVSVNDNEISD